MPSLRDDLMGRLWPANFNPYRGVDLSIQPDCQGWNSEHPWLGDAVAQKSCIAIDLGAWKGASAIRMAKQMKFADLDSAVIAIDTFCGSAEHWLDPQIPRHPDGSSSLYQLFLRNVVEAGVQNYIIPLPLDTASAATVLLAKNIQPSVIHIDAAHDFESVYSDLQRWWGLLAPGGVMLIDDVGNPHWPTVEQALRQFHTRLGWIEIKVQDMKAWMEKPKTGD